MEGNREGFVKPPSWETEFVLDVLSSNEVDVPEFVSALQVTRASPNLAVAMMVSRRGGRPYIHGEPFVIYRLGAMNMNALQWKNDSWSVIPLGAELPAGIAAWEISEATRLRTKLRRAYSEFESADDVRLDWEHQFEKFDDPPISRGCRIGLACLLIGLALLAWLNCLYR
jgi:hypothetical protein